MSSEDREVYIMSGAADDEEWVTPTPANTAIVEAVSDETDLEADELDLDEHVDWTELRDVLEGDAEAFTFEIDDYEITVHDDGDIDVE